MPCSVGAYSGSTGYPFVTENIAKFINKRDGHPSNPKNIYLLDGASNGVHLLLTTLLNTKSEGVMIPIP